MSRKQGMPESKSGTVERLRSLGAGADKKRRRQAETGRVLQDILHGITDERSESVIPKKKKSVKTKSRYCGKPGDGESQTRNARK
ncbi:MAG TPA: hypothetical protein ENN63_11565 [Bacteroidetes bacterium]|nr:hypothetical protein [Bacteroidota bacterium]